MKRLNDVLVGVVVLGVVVATTAGIAWVKQTDIRGGRHDVVAQFHDVGNARVGNAVVIRGVIGGRIQAIELAPGGWVDVRLRIDPAVRMPSNPVVLLNESSLFGEWQATVIERSALPHDDAVIREIADPSRERGAIPGATLPGIGKLTAVAGQIAGDVANVAGRVEVAFDEQAARDLRASIRNVSQLSATLAGTVRDHATDLDTLSTHVRAAVSALNRAAATVQTTARRIDSATTSEQARRAADDLAAGVAELRRAAAQMRDLSERFARSQAHLDAMLTRGDSVLGKINAGQGSLGLMVNDPSLYRHTDSLLVQLRALVADIQANPKRYVSVRLF
jgi:phospholipid/cholesterol/gamma-HCH transport system substrate-binding protein